MNDIEAAARALFLNLECEENHYIDPTKLPALRSALRSALAHAARGEPVRRWRDVEGTLPARRDGDKVARVDEVVPSFLAPTPPPATGEAGTRGEVEKARERFMEAARGYGEILDHLDRVYGTDPGPVFLKAYRNLLAAERALPEAREGGRG